MRPAPVAGDDRGEAAPFEAPQKVADHVLGQEGHVTRRDEDEWVSRGRKAGLQAGQGSLCAGTLARDPPGALHSGALPAYYQDLPAAGCQGVVVAVDEGR